MFFDEWLEHKKKKKTRSPYDMERIVYPPKLRTIISNPMDLPAFSDVMLDGEFYINYSLLAFKHIDSNQYFYMEYPFDTDALKWALAQFVLYTFNGMEYDLPLIGLILKGCDCKELKRYSDAIILQGERANASWLPFNHVDLLDVAPLSASLKAYGARLHCERLQELPIDPHKHLSEDEKLLIRDYCFNDLDITHLLREELRPHIALREKLGREFGQDLRSRSDAQLAQEIINGELHRVTGKKPKKPGDATGRVFQYEAPTYIGFRSAFLQEALAGIQAASITVGATGHVICPSEIEGRTFVINGKVYKIGIGGIHSQEENQALVATDDVLIIDKDVTGYYPNLILKNAFYPEHLGPAFLEALGGIVDRRYAAKKSGDKVTADSLKIASNGTFGKTSDPFSTIYDPKMMVQTTITGQLSLLMLIEELELNDIPVKSANTDGIVIACPASKLNMLGDIIGRWEQRTALETEETRYKALYSRDVNNYIAIKEDGSTKPKGVYSELGSALNSVLSKNPEHLVCSDAVQAFLAKGIPIEQTIYECKDIRRFIVVRNVKGGGYKDNIFLGKVVRWYYAKDCLGTINYCLTGNKVPNSDGAMPYMEITGFPADLDFDWYIAKCNKMLYDLGYLKPSQSDLFN